MLGLKPVLVACDQCGDYISRSGRNVDASLAASFPDRTSADQFAVSRGWLVLGRPTTHTCPLCQSPSARSRAFQYEAIQ